MKNYAVGYATRKALILEDQATPFWLRDAIRTLEGKDPVDAASYCDELAHLMSLRRDAVLAGQLH